jgi:hypothetical protein
MDKILGALTKPITRKSWPLEPGDGDVTESPKSWVSTIMKFVSGFR